MRAGVGLRRRWPCWPGPYSRLLIGLLARPHRFTPRRRLILYFDWARLLISVRTLARDKMQPAATGCQRWPMAAPRCPRTRRKRREYTCVSGAVETFRVGRGVPHFSGVKQYLRA